MRLVHTNADLADDVEERSLRGELTKVELDMIREEISMRKRYLLPPSRILQNLLINNFEGK